MDATLSLSKTISLCGKSYFRSVSANTKRPLWNALATSLFAISSSSRGSAVEQIMNSTGKLPPPGSAAGVNAITRTPGIVEERPKTSPTIFSVLRVRSLHGLVTSPENPPKASVI